MSCWYCHGSLVAKPCWTILPLEATNRVGERKQPRHSHGSVRLVVRQSLASGLAVRKRTRRNNKVQVARRHPCRRQTVERLGVDAPGDDFRQFAFMFWRARKDQKVSEPAQRLPGGTHIGVCGMLEYGGRAHGWIFKGWSAKCRNCIGILP